MTTLIEETRIAEFEGALKRLIEDYIMLREALKPFAEYAEMIEKEHPGWDHDGFSFTIGYGADIPMKWFIEARKALGRR